MCLDTDLQSTSKATISFIEDSGWHWARNLSSRKQCGDIDKIDRGHGNPKVTRYCEDRSLDRSVAVGQLDAVRRLVVDRNKRTLQCRIGS